MGDGCLMEIDNRPSPRPIQLHGMWFGGSPGAGLTVSRFYHIWQYLSTCVPQLVCPPPPTSLATATRNMLYAAP